MIIRELGHDSSRFVMLVAGALLGFESITIVQLISITELSRPLFVAVICFSIAVPLLSSMVIFIPRPHEVIRMTDALAAMWAGGLLASIVGISSLFFHFHIAAGISFLVAMMASASLAGFHTDAVRHLEPERDDKTIDSSAGHS